MRSTRGLLVPPQHKAPSTCNSKSSIAAKGKEERSMLRSTIVILGAIVAMASCSSSASASSSFSDFTVSDGKGQPFPLSKYQDTPAVLVVNVASQCGYTDSNYRELQALRQSHDEEKLAILAFPCNQFGRQEPGTYDEILSFVDKQYGVTFPVMDKIDVNGEGADPLFKWLKISSGDSLDIPWNFNKFLVVCGKEVKRYSHQVNPMQIEGDIANAIKQCPAPAQEL